MVSKLTVHTLVDRFVPLDPDRVVLPVTFDGDADPNVTLPLLSDCACVPVDVPDVA